jgi:hypothetical protein
MTAREQLARLLTKNNELFTCAAERTPPGHDRPRVAHGRPAIRGTRMRVADVLSLLAAGAAVTVSLPPESPRVWVLCKAIDGTPGIDSASDWVCNANFVTATVLP